jgi:hypothetical protein
VDPYIHSPICLHGVMLNSLSTGTTFYLIHLLHLHVVLRRGNSTLTQILRLAQSTLNGNVEICSIPVDIVVSGSERLDSLKLSHDTVFLLQYLENTDTNKIRCSGNLYLGGIGKGNVTVLN